MYTLELNDNELRLLTAALHSYMDDFGHHESDLVNAVKAIIERLPNPEPETAT